MTSTRYLGTTLLLTTLLAACEGGASGSQGAMGDMGDEGVIGPQGETGPQGEPGQPGIGPQGVPGLPGSIGPQGDPGQPGAIGPQGDPGPAGAIGPQGVPGPFGAMGPQGSQGPHGAQGQQGVAGAIGPHGDIGPQGIAGSQGNVGDIGPQGDTGPQGVAGSQGSVGAAGPQGSVGPQGNVGAQGPGMTPDVFVIPGFGGAATGGYLAIVSSSGRTVFNVFCNYGGPNGSSANWVAWQSSVDAGEVTIINRVHGEPVVAFADLRYNGGGQDEVTRGGSPSLGFPWQAVVMANDGGEITRYDVTVTGTTTGNCTVILYGLDGGTASVTQP